LGEFLTLFFGFHVSFDGLADNESCHRYELLAEPQRDITPEQAAAKLRAVSPTLYRKKLVTNGAETDTKSSSNCNVI